MTDFEIVESIPESGVVAPEEPNQPEKGGDPTPAVEGKDTKTSDAAKEAAQLKKELAQVRKTVSELQQSERYWADKAKNVAPKAEPKVDEPDWDAEDPEKLVDDFSKNGVKALKARGFISRKEVLALVEKRAAEIAENTSSEKVGKALESLTADIQFASANPELQKADSPFTLRVKELMETDPELDGLSAGQRLKLATRLARAEMQAAPPAAEEEAPRARSAHFDRSRSTNGAGSVTSPQTLAILKGMGVDPAKFRETKRQMGGN